MSGLLCAPRGAPALRLPFVSARSVVLSVPPGAVRRMHAAPRATQPALRPSLLRCSAPRTGSIPQPAAPAPDSPALSEQDYHDAADSTLDELQDRFDAFIEAVPDLVQDPEARVEEWDVEVASGVLNVSTPWGVYVINKQPATQQVWLSSPVSGPYRMDYAPVAGKAPSWVSHRDEQGDVELWALLRTELGRISLNGDISPFFDAPSEF